ncbi:zinc ABC transporter substrate-binding protein [Halomonas piscis]|uniref:Zinc ABC transporter substrate-binding protein n=1 Tax=Halomonas piscis TaxID=3031727 RepID=A0ABY9Z2V9_9GAMM|nr:zinc ABC transporter substrate-binding protein [Halomonas piscis]WNK20563.1 zinc ABC transporter substrate-binding protein [Halomonas piscis]
MRLTSAFRHALALALSATLFATLALLPPAAAAAEVRVVASFSILADMARQVGGEHVEVTSLIGTDSDAHSYSPSPGDVRTLSRADLVVFNGLNFEGWMERLLKTSDYQGRKVVATEGIEPLKHAGHDHGGADPHAWQDMERAKTYVANIRDALVKADGDNAAAYRANADDYLARLDEADADIRQRLEAIADDTAVITGHASFGYFAQGYGLRFLAPQGLATSAAPSAARMAELIEVIETQNVRALFYENMTSPNTIDQLAEESGLPIAGTLYADALASEGEAASYIGMMRHNARVLHRALAN